MNSLNLHTSGSGQKILPIFNMRKRPRQALYAVPSSQESRNKEVVPSFPINHGNLPASHEMQQSSSFMQHNASDASTQFKGTWNKPSSSFDSPSKSFKQSTCTKPNPQFNTCQNQARKLPPMQQLPPSTNKVNSARSQWSYNQSTTTRTAVPLKNSAQNFQKQQKGIHLENPTYNNAIKYSKETTFQADVSQNLTQDSFNKATNHDWKQTTSERTTNEKSHTKEIIGSSLRILTVCVEGVKKWSQVLSHEMLMFEVFGLLNSEVTFNPEKTAKKFTLKDGNHTMQCIFYETDRVMPQLRRSQWIRCVGIFQNNITIFQCVSVREVSPTEQRWMKAQMGACEKALKSYASIVKMEP